MKGTDLIVVLYGTGGEAKDFIKRKDEKWSVLCAVGSDTYANDEAFMGVPLRNDSFLNEIDEPYVLVIASQYFNLIHDRLSDEGKLANNNLKEIYIPALMRRRPPYDGDELNGLTSEDWEWLENNIEDDSLELLQHIKYERTCGSYPTNEYIRYEDGLYHAGYENYWDTISGRRIHKSAVVIDAGAYVGDTVNILVRNIGGKVDTYYALEPMRDSFDLLCKGKYEDIRSFKPMCCALGRKNGDQVFSNSYEHNDAFSINQESIFVFWGAEVNNQKVDIITLDSLDFTKDADYFVKMDIEGSEMDALRGGESFIKEKRPNLAVCLYHKDKDLIQIPQYIKSIVPDYELHLVGGSHTILIAR